MGFDLVFIGEGEYSLLSFLHRLVEGRRDVGDIRGMALMAQDSNGKQRILRTGGLLYRVNACYPRIGVEHHRLGAIEIGRGCPDACGFCQRPFSMAPGCAIGHWRMLSALEQLVRAGLKDIRFITPEFSGRSPR